MTSRKILHRRSIFAPETLEALRKIRAYDRVAVLDEIERHLRHEPRKTSRSRIKELRDLRHPQYRRRFDDLRVFYDISENRVEIRGVMHKRDMAAWLRRWGIGAQGKGTEE